jgi:hypothetical protein
MGRAAGKRASPHYSANSTAAPTGSGLHRRGPPWVLARPGVRCPPPWGLLPGTGGRSVARHTVCGFVGRTDAAPLASPGGATPAGRRSSRCTSRIVRARPAKTHERQLLLGNSYTGPASAARALCGPASSWPVGGRPGSYLRDLGTSLAPSGARAARTRPELGTRSTSCWTRSTECWRRGPRSSPGIT